jgi:hypothetical protein
LSAAPRINLAAGTVAKESRAADTAIMPAITRMAISAAFESFAFNRTVANQPSAYRGLECVSAETISKETPYAMLHASVAVREAIFGNTPTESEPITVFNADLSSDFAKERELSSFGISNDRSDILENLAEELSDDLLVKVSCL